MTSNELLDRFAVGLVVAAIVHLVQVVAGRIVGLLLVIALGCGALMVTEMGSTRIDRQLRSVVRTTVRAAKLLQRGE